MFALLLLGACSREDHDDGVTQITVVGYRGAFGENFQKAVIDPFNRAHPGIRVRYFGIQNAAAALGMMRAQRTSPPANLVITDLSVAKVASDEGLLADLDLSALSHYPDMGNTGRELGPRGVPITYDNVVMIYNVEAYGARPPTSWEALWDPRQRGKVIVPAQGGGDIQAILLTIIANRLAGNDDYKRTIEIPSPAVVRYVRA
jgi:putative spermidine/putrescine transport system substrate-binding protein